LRLNTVYNRRRISSTGDGGRRVETKAYWRANLRLMGILLTLWFVVSFGCGILLVEPLNQIRIGGFKLGFWIAQQGSIYFFVILIFVYVILMKRLDRQYGVAD